MTFKLVLPVVVAAAVSGQSGNDVWVWRLSRFQVDSFNSGDWIVSPQWLDLMPGHGCTGVSAEDGRHCGISEIGEFGEVTWFWFYENELGEGLKESRGDLIARFPDGELKRVWGIRSVTARTRDASVFRHGDATFVHLQLRYPGTGSHREDVLFQWRDDHWQEMDTLSWRKEITLPPCYGMWKGPFIDFHEMTLESDVWIEGDGNCCPSGGKLTASFAIVGNRLSVADWSHDIGEGSLSDPWRQLDRNKCLEPAR